MVLVLEEFILEDKQQELQTNNRKQRRERSYILKGLGCGFIKKMAFV